MPPVALGTLIIHAAEGNGESKKILGRTSPEILLVRRPVGAFRTGAAEF
jgi:hypothetical protein